MPRQKYKVRDEENNNDGKETNSPLSLQESLNKSFKSSFYKLGLIVGNHPVPFIIVPVILCLLLTIGWFRFTYENDPLHLFTPFEGPAHDERAVLDKWFPMNATSRFTPSRMIRPGRGLRVFVKAKDGGSIFRKSIWDETTEIDNLVRNTPFIYAHQSFVYEDVCSKWEGDCFRNDVLQLADFMDQIEAGNMTLNYPTMFNPATLSTYYLPVFFGGVKVSNDSKMVFAKALLLMYFVDSLSPEKDLRGYEWEGAVMNAVDNLKVNLKSVIVEEIGWRSMGEEVDQNIWLAIPLFAITIPIMVIFVSISMMTRDQVRTKPWLGIAAVSATLLGGLSGFSVANLAGVPFISMNMTGCFLILGIGIDDSFVMLAAWRKTPVDDPVPTRLAKAYAEAAVSITITSLTDMFSFWVGVAAPFHSVRIFCLYTGSAVVGTYICHITVFGAAMALSGYHEQKKRSGIFFWREGVTVEKELEKGSTDKTADTTGLKNTQWVHQTNEAKEEEYISDHGLMTFFRTTWSNWINKDWVKKIIIVVFVLYLGVSCWGISQIEEGLRFKTLTIDNSNAQNYFITEDTYFKGFFFRIQVVVTGDLDYSDKNVQAKIESMMRQIEETKYVGNEGKVLNECWLRNFLRYAHNLEEADLPLNLTTEASFSQSLRENYLPPSSVFSEDVKFNEDGTKILATRYIIQTVNTWSSREEVEMVQTFRAIAAAQSPHLNVTLYNPYFMFFDQLTVIRSTTLKSVAITSVIMIAISLVFIPSHICSLWVGLSIVSIETGVLGFLVLWGVRLDVVSSICLIISIGFSVDFSVHISYAYICSEGSTPDERVRDCLHSMGMPIIQGALSTIVGVMSLINAPSYVMLTFAKSITLVMIIAAAHGLLLLPVLLSLFSGSGTGLENKGHVGKGMEINGKYKRRKSIG